MFDKNRNFLTPLGLKIRLDYEYFFYQLRNTDKHYADEEILNNDVMYNATANIETLFLVPVALIQIFTIVAIIMHLDTHSFLAISAVLYIFGCVWRCSEQYVLMSTILMFLASVYISLRWLFYLSFVILFFALDGTYLIAPYLIARMALGVLSLLGNDLLSLRMMKKYGMPFNDTEICAFRVFHVLSHSNLKFSDYIAGYVSAVEPPKKQSRNLHGWLRTRQTVTPGVDDIRDSLLFCMRNDCVLLHVLDCETGYQERYVPFSKIKVSIDRVYEDDYMLYAYTTIRNSKKVTVYVRKSTFARIQGMYESEKLYSCCVLHNKKIEHKDISVAKITNNYFAYFCTSGKETLYLIQEKRSYRAVDEIEFKATHSFRISRPGRFLRIKWKFEDFADRVYAMSNPKKILTVGVITVAVVAIVAVTYNIGYDNGLFDGKLIESPVDRKDQSTTVYVTPSGTKYHRKNCTYVRGGGYVEETTVAKARKTGYSPCSKCRPDAK